MSPALQTLEKIVSGGQTGVDRGALDAAVLSNFPCGGWCPDGRVAEDGVISSRYPLTELSGGNYRARTARNVADSDGTVVFHFGPLAGGTASTRDECTAQRKPLLMIDGRVVKVDLATRQLDGFIRKYSLRVLNVAGPRLSEDSRGYQYARSVIHQLISDENSAEDHINP